MTFLKNKKIVVIGVGNMGEALIRGMLRDKKVSRINLYGIDADKRKLNAKVRRFGFKKTKDLSIITRADVVILAVKPQKAGELIEGLRGFLREQTLVISVAAGITARWLEKKIGKKIPVIRSMPNTPALIGKGMIVLARGAHARKSHELLAKKILSCSGRVISLHEKHMNSVTAVSGSGPAYVFYLAEAMIDAGVSLGLGRPTSELLTRQTLEGAAHLLACLKDSPEELRKKVTSPGGTTEAAIKRMEKDRVKKCIVEAIRQAKIQADKLIKR